MRNVAKENFTNFATTALVTPSPLTAGGTSFTVTASQGALFPTSNFTVTIDSEILLIASRSGDTFTVGQRGYDGSTAASHTVGATVQLSACAQFYNHLWQNTPDTYKPEVPPAAQMAGLSASSWDNEFEALGSWTLYPSSPGSGTTWNVHTGLRSHLLLDRGSTDNASYYAYVGFNPPASTPFLVTAKLSLALNYLQAANTNDQLQASLFVCDASNPTGTVSNSFRMRAQYLTNINTGGASYFSGAYNYTYACQVFAMYNSGGSGNNQITPLVTPAPMQTLFLRIAFNGSTTYTGYIGDGWTYWPIGQKSGLGFTPQSLGWVFQNYVPSGSGFNGTHAVDYVRVVTGSANPRFGS